MNRILAAALVALASQVAHADDSAYFRNVAASFDAMLDHVPYGGATVVAVASMQRDRAEEIVHSALRGEQPSTQLALSDDAAAAAIVRMLNHTAYHGPTEVTVALRLDAVAELVHSRLQHQDQDQGAVHLVQAAQ